MRTVCAILIGVAFAQGSVQSLTFAQRFLELASEKPEQPFLLLNASVGSRGGGDWTYGRTASVAHRIGSLLCEANAASVGCPDLCVVAFFGLRSAATYAALLGAWLAAPCQGSGRRFVPALLNPWASSAELRRALSLLRPTSLVLSRIGSGQATALEDIQAEAPESFASLASVIELEGPAPIGILPGLTRLQPLVVLTPHEASPGTLNGESSSTLADDDDAPALVLFTSGSTAAPKAVVLPHRQLRYGTDALLRMGIGGAMETAHKNVVAAAVSLHWDVAVYDFGLALALGGSLLVLREDAIFQPTPDSLHAALRQRGATVLSGAPDLFDWLFFYREDDEEEDVDEYVDVDEDEDEQRWRRPQWVSPGVLSWFVSTGDRFPFGLGQKLRQLLQSPYPLVAQNLAVVDCYGGTEFSNVAHRLLPLDAETEDVWPSWLFDESIMSVRSEVVGEGGGESYSTGELVLSGQGLMLGYLTEEEQWGIANARAISEFANGDLVNMSDAGKFDIVGRVDRQVRIDGVRTNLDAVEALVETHCTSVSAVAAVPFSDQKGVHLFVVAAAGFSQASASTGVLRCGRETLRLAHPLRVHVEATLPRTASGKKDRRVLVARCPKLEEEARAGDRECSIWCITDCEFSCGFMSKCEDSCELELEARCEQKCDEQCEAGCEDEQCEASREEKSSSAMQRSACSAWCVDKCEDQCDKSCSAMVDGRYEKQCFEACSAKELSCERDCKPSCYRQCDSLLGSYHDVCET